MVIASEVVVNQSVSGPRSRFSSATGCLCALSVALAGCGILPETRLRDSVYNPFPQLQRVAVLPFFNQSGEATVDGERVAEAYYAALQSVPGFEVLPIGVTKAQYSLYAMRFGEPRMGRDFQQLAQFLDVDAVVIGSVTDFDSYYPPRVGLATRWYAANPGFHPIPAGYGLPWGTDAESRIPRRVTREAEFELARNQLRTQSPRPQEFGADGAADGAGVPAPSAGGAGAGAAGPGAGGSDPGAGDPGAGDPGAMGSGEDTSVAGLVGLDGHRWPGSPEDHEPLLPPDWPDPSGFIPDPPSPAPPVVVPNHEPVLSHTRLYRGDDAYVTGRLADYVETGDDARPVGWQGYLSRSDDFIRFCCHLHVVEMLESRGGREESDLILRWPLSRY